MQRKSIIIGVALVAGLALGIIVGPTLRGPVASAQTQPPGQPQTATAGGALWNLFLDKLAAALNTQRAALDSAITSAGASAADEAVQQGTLTQVQADALKARIQAGDLGALFGGRGGFGGHQLGGVKPAMLDAAAKALNITTAELQTQLRSGQTLAQLAQAHGTTEQAVTSATLAAAKTQLDQAVSSGTLTQAQADTIYAQLQQQGANLLGPGGPGGRGGFPGGPALGGAQQAMLDAAAKALDITTVELQTQLRSGQTLAQLAQAHGTTEQAVTNAALAAAKTQFDQAVSSGTLTQAQADTIYAQLQQQGTNLLTPHGRGPRGGDRPGAPTNPQAPAATPQART